MHDINEKITTLELNKKLADEIKEKIILLEQEIAEHYQIKIGSTKTITTNIYKINIKRPLLKTYDNAKMQNIYNESNDEIKNELFNVKYQIYESKLKLIENENNDLFTQIADATTTKMGKIAVKIC